VLIGKFSGTEVTIEGEEHVILREEEILAKIT
jgi:co-chaperonin GroES (HSP10)